MNMGNGTKLGMRAVLAILIAIAAAAVGILTPILSDPVGQDVRVDGKAISLSVSGVPESVSPGSYFRIVATMANNANRPIPAVLRMEVRNPNSTTPDELTVYAGCGAEEVVSSRTLLYYIGWHGPLLAPKGVSYPAGTNVASLAAALGGAEYWGMVLREIETRDPLGYASLVEPGANATTAVRSSGSPILRVLYYYDMIAATGTGLALSDWALTMPFSDRVIANGGPEQDGFLVEIHPQSRGSFEFTFWAERPDGLGIPNHPFACGPL
jgi:hypothetical protein